MNSIQIRGFKKGIASAWKIAFGIPEWIMGVILAVIAILVFAGGISRITSFTEKLVPFMTIRLYAIIVFICVFVGAFVLYTQSFALTSIVTKSIKKDM